MEVLLRTIPKGWNSKPLGESAKLFGGYAFKSVDYTKKGIKLLKISNVSHSEIVWDEKSFLPEHYWNDFPEYRIHKGDIVLAMTRPIISTGLKISFFNDDQKTLLNQRVGKFIINDSLKPVFLFYFLNQKYFLDQIKLRISESNQPNISSNEVEHIPIWYPKDILEQEKIASILSNVDSLIQQTQKKIEQTQKLKKGLMQKLLTKGIGHTRFKETKLGKIPESWNFDKIKKVSEKLVVGFVGTCDPFYTDNTGIPMLRTTNVKEGQLDLSNLKYVTRDFHEKNKKSQVRQNDLLVSRHGQSGEACLAKGLLESNCMNIVIVRPRESMFIPKFFELSFNSAIVRKQIQRTTAGGVQGVVNTSEIGKVKIIIPSLKEQQKISLILYNVDYIIQKQQENKIKLETLKKGLMQKLLTGQIRVKI